MKKIILFDGFLKVTSNLLMILAFWGSIAARLFVITKNLR